MADSLLLHAHLRARLSCHLRTREQGKGWQTPRYRTRTFDPDRIVSEVKTREQGKGWQTPRYRTRTFEPR